MCLYIRHTKKKKVNNPSRNSANEYSLLTFLLLCRASLSHQRIVVVSKFKELDERRQLPIYYKDMANKIPGSQRPTKETSYTGHALGGHFVLPHFDAFHRTCKERTKNKQSLQLEVCYPVGLI